MAPPSADSSGKERPPEKNHNYDDNDMTPAAAPGSYAVTLRMRNFAATSMKQENETDWDSESYHLQPMGLSDQEGWDIGNEPPAVKHGHMGGADSRAEAPTSNTHPPDPMHSSMPDSSPVADKDIGAPDRDHDIDTKEGEKT